jgi:trehalose 6-phosphate phosphatase
MLHAKELNKRLSLTERLWLFLDYDGTLADFAPTPEHVEPDPELVMLLTRLVSHPRFRLAVISGRRLKHIQALVPVSGILLAGTYGVEMLTPDGKRIDQLPYETVRPPLTALKPHWANLIADREGFFLEDKGWALALHARFADDEETEAVLAAAHQLATKSASSGPFRLLGGHKFLEIGPKLAHKGRTVELLLEQYSWPDSIPLYVGDDDKDEEAFSVIQANGGVAVLVTSQSVNQTIADFFLESPLAVRHWLKSLISNLSSEKSDSYLTQGKRSYSRK